MKCTDRGPTLYAHSRGSSLYSFVYCLTVTSLVVCLSVCLRFLFIEECTHAFYCCKYTNLYWEITFAVCFLLQFNQSRMQGRTDKAYTYRRYCKRIHNKTGKLDIIKHAWMWGPNLIRGMIRCKYTTNISPSQVYEQEKSKLWWNYRKIHVLYTPWHELLKVTKNYEGPMIPRADGIIGPLYILTS